MSSQIVIVMPRSYAMALAITGGKYNKKAFTRKQSFAFSLP